MCWAGLVSIRAHQRSSMNRSLTFAIALSVSAMSACPAQQETKSPAVTPQPRVEDWWVQRQAEKVAEGC